MAYCVKTMYSFLGSFLLLGLYSSGARAEETVPIPPKRPNVLSASQSYIEQLKNGAINKDGSLKDFTPQIHKGTTQAKEDDQTAILQDKFAQKSTQSDLNTIDPATTEATLNNTAKNEDTTLVSFMMQPEQIHLDQNITSFLKEYAVKTLNENNRIKMEIHAYARPIDNKEFSDVRLALARALEVRSFLIQQNIDPSRMKLSPMGKDKINDSNDRIDLLFIEENTP